MKNVWTPAYVGVGSNLNDPELQLNRGLSALATLPDTRVMLTSSLYRTAPLGPQDQPHYMNAVVALITRLSSIDLLRALKSLEQQLGREQPVQRWGPRLIDFDLLMQGDECIASDELTLPHASLHERNFVLIPFAEIAPHVWVPGKSQVATLAARIDHNGVEKMIAPAAR